MRLSGSGRTRLQRALILLAVVVLVACSEEPQSALRGGPPNILLILVDDMGYGDLGANRGSAPGVSLTPHLDALAAQGVRFTRHYVDSTCAATRAGILSGTAPISRGFRPAGLGISPEIVTLPERLQSLGYTTHHVGKWHLGYASRLAWPTAQGFDEFYGFLSQFLLRGPHTGGQWRFARPTYNDPWLQTGTADPVRTEGHLSDLLLDRVLDFLDAAPARDSPWFLNFWTFLPHKPLEPAVRYAERFPSTAEGRYRAMISQLDDLVGSVLERLQQHGLADSTLVLIASDNGGAQVDFGSNLPFAGGKMSFQEGGVRTPLLMRWPDGLGAGTVRDEPVSYLDYLPTLVRVAGGEVPADLPGRDLGVLLRGGGLASQSLFWEAGNARSISWSVLSPEGRWRLHKFFGMDPVLNDLQADPTGSTDASGDHPQVLAALLRDYRNWRHAQRALELRFEGDVSGHGQLLGEALQRAPGFGGFSFAIGVTPAADAAETDEQVIAVHPGLWQLRQAEGQLQLEVGDIRLQAPPPEAGRCTPLVVSAQVSFNRIAPEMARARVGLFVDGKLVAERALPRPSLPADNFLLPTFIGRDASGGRRYAGTLTRPVVLNEPLLAEPEPWAQNGVSRVSDPLCGGNPQ